MKFSKGPTVEWGQWLQESGKENGQWQEGKDIGENKRGLLFGS